MRAKLSIMPVEDPPVGLEIQDLASRLAGELRSAAAAANDCQIALGDIVKFGVTSEAAVRIQSLDALTQQLDELSRMLERLSAAPHLGQAPLDILGDVRLDDLKLRLMGETVVEAESGEADFF